MSPAFQGLVTSPWLGTDLTGQAKRVVSQATMDNVPGEIHKDAKKATIWENEMQTTTATPSGRELGRA